MYVLGEETSLVLQYFNGGVDPIGQKTEKNEPIQLEILEEVEDL